MKIYAKKPELVKVYTFEELFTASSEYSFQHDGLHCSQTGEERLKVTCGYGYGSIVKGEFIVVSADGEFITVNEDYLKENFIDEESNANDDREPQS